MPNSLKKASEAVILAAIELKKLVNRFGVSQGATDRQVKDIMVAMTCAIELTLAARDATLEFATLGRLGAVK